MALQLAQPIANSFWNYGAEAAAAALGSYYTYNAGRNLGRRLVNSWYPSKARRLATGARLKSYRNVRNVKRFSRLRYTKSGKKIVVRPRRGRKRLKPQIPKHIRDSPWTLRQHLANYQLTQTPGRQQTNVCNEEFNFLTQYDMTTHMSMDPNSSERTFVEKCSVKWYMCNFGQNNAYVDIYPCYPRQGLLNTTTPTEVWNQGETDVDAGATSTTSIGYTPYMNHAFCRLYSIGKKKSYTLIPGAEKVYSYSRNVNKTLSNDTATPNPGSSGVPADTTDRGFVPGLSVGFLVIARAGQVDNDDTNVSTFAACKIGFIFQKTFKYRQVEGTTKNVIDVQPILSTSETANSKIMRAYGTNTSTNIISSNFA